MAAFSVPAGRRGLPLPLRRAAAKVGRRYLLGAPHESSALDLRLGLGGGRTMGLAEAAEAAVRLRPGDFARGDTVVVDGWLLARSEARFCALVYLDGTRSHVS